MVEFALTFSILMTFVFVFMEICLVFYTYEMISEMAREGTRYAMVRGATCANVVTHASCTATASAVNTYVSGLAWPNPGGATPVPATSYPDGDEAGGHRVQVKITYTFPIHLPYVPKSAITMSSTSQMTIIQ